VARWPEPGLDDVFGDGQPALVAVVEECRDPGNAGTIIRAADAAGAAGVIFTAASVDVRSGKVIRASAGSLFHLPVVQGPTLAEALAAIRAAGLQVLAAHPSGREAAPDLHAPTAWLFGNEAHGLSAQAREAADGIVGIPMYGRAESLNLAMAATLCLYASATAQGAGDELWNNVRRV
jgi:TrmH family RNA methyltransferase